MKAGYQGGVPLPLGKALIVGLKRVDPAAYHEDSMSSGCWGAEDDVDRIIRIVAAKGFRLESLKTEAAKAGAILDNLERAARSVRAGDLFLFYFAGHGDQIADLDGDEEDGRDETLLAFDRPIRDDELDERWRTFAEGARILMISDSCHSGTNFKMAGGRFAPRIRPPSVPRRARAPMRASLLHIGACRDEGNAVGYHGGGAFTIALSEVFSSDFRGSYRDLVQVVSPSLPSQVPQLNVYGPGSERFVDEPAFLI
jgi:metacaspase-1